jgi:hypothetical protein
VAPEVDIDDQTLWTRHSTVCYDINVLMIT